MRRIILFLFGLIVSIGANADKVTEQQALQKAQQFMKGKNMTVSYSRSFARSDNPKDDQAFYIFNAENNGGFVIVSGDDRTTDILGYSDKGKFNEDCIPSNLRWLLSFYQHVIDSVGKAPRTPNRAKTRNFAQERKEISPLLSTQWGQFEPYNSLCPTIDGKRCVTGCVATAIAQVLNYNRWPQGQTSSIEGYTTEKESIIMPQLEPTSFDWNNMTAEEVARLMLYCGQAVKMDYGTKESSDDLNDLESVLTNTFGYSRAVNLKNRNLLYYNDDLWESILYDELSANRVILYSGSSWSEPGHAWVVDGYKDGYFHMNWGWDGDFDGFYKLSGISLDALIAQYDMNHVAYVGIIPPTDNESKEPKVFNTFINFNCETQITTKGYVSRASKTDAFPAFSVSADFTNDIACTQHIGLGLINKEGEIFCLIEEEHSFTENDFYNLGKGVSVGSEFENGDYKLVAICKDKETDDWQTPFGCNSIYIEVTIDDLMITLHTIPDGTHSKDYKEIGIYDIDGVTYFLYSDYDNQCLARVLPKQVTGKYSGEIVVPSEVEYDGISYRVFYEDHAFHNCEELTSLTLANSDVESIYGCPNLTNLVLQEGVYRFGYIGKLSQLESLELPSTLISSFGDFISEGCEKLKTIRFKGTMVTFVQDVPNWSESILPALTDIYFPSYTPPTIIDQYTYKPKTDLVPANPNAKIHIPAGALELYKQSNWRNWAFVEDLPAPTAVTWGYCHSDAVSNSGEGVSSSRNDVEYAILVPVEELAIYKGSKITQIQVFSPPRPTNDYKDEDYEYVFITKRGTDYIIKQPFNIVRGTWNTIELETPYTISDEYDLFVGIGKHGSIGVLYSDQTKIKGATWGRAMGDDYTCVWKPGVWVKPNADYPLPIRFTIEGEGMPTGVVVRDLQLLDNEDYSEARTRATDPSMKLQGTIRNRSLNTVHSYNVEWIIDGTEKGSQLFESILAPNACDFITIELPESLRQGNHKIHVNVSGVNDETNEMSEKNSPTLDLGSGETIIDITDITIDIKDSGKTTYCGNNALDFSGFEDLKAYVATGYESDGTIWLTRIKQVPVGTSVLIKGEANQTYEVPVLDKCEAYFENMFQGSADENQIISTTTADGKYKNFYMASGQFKPVSDKGQTIKAGKCYLQVPASFKAAAAGENQTMKIADSGKSSYAPPVDLDLTEVEGLKAYAATGYDAANSTIWLTRINKIQAGEGVILKGEAGKEYTLPSAAVQAYYGNMFVGNIGSKITINETSDDGEWTNFYLASGSFKKVSGSREIGTNKSYLHLPTSLLVNSTRGKKNAFAEVWLMEELETEIMHLGSIGDDDDGTTRIDAIGNESTQPDVYYNLQGQRVINPKKGLYIQNGKKIVIK